MLRLIAKIDALLVKVLGQFGQACLKFEQDQYNDKRRRQDAKATRKAERLDRLEQNYQNSLSN